MEKDDFSELYLFELYQEINLHSLLKKIADKIKEYLSCEASAIFLYDSKREELYFEIATGEKEEELKKISFKKNEGVVGWVASHEKSVIINDCSKDPRFTSKADEKTDFTTRSLVGVPVRMDGKLLGVLEAINKVEGEFVPRDLEILQKISSFVGIPLQNALLFRKVTQETREKDKLIQLAQTISSSFNVDEVFETLKEIILDNLQPLEINVMVKSQNRVYRLLGNPPQKNRRRDILETDIRSDQAIFPLRTLNTTLGYLEVIMGENMPEEFLSLLRGLAIFTAISIEKFELHSQMLEKERVEKELQIARDIQQSFLLNENVPLKGVESAFLNVPSSAVGGDYYDIIKVNDNQTIFTINDVSGHGVPASLIMTVFRSNFIFRVKQDKDLLKTVQYLNCLIAETTEPNLYVTSFTSLVDTKSMKLSYINAGHVPPVLIRKKEVIELGEGAVVLGMFPGVDYSIMDVDIQPNDLLIMFTDGVLEAENPQGEQYGLERLIQFLKSHQKLELQEIKTKLLEDLKTFVQTELFTDDVTFVLIRIQE